MLRIGPAWIGLFVSEHAVMDSVQDRTVHCRRMIYLLPGIGDTNSIALPLNLGNSYIARPSKERVQRVITDRYLFRMTAGTSSGVV